MRYVILNNSGHNISSICQPQPDMLAVASNDCYYTDLDKALRALEEAVERFPMESSRDGGFTLKQLPEEGRIIARYSWRIPRKGFVEKTRY